MSNEQLVAMIKVAVHEAMTDGAIVSQETHENHHRWIQAQIKRAEACIRNRQRITTTVIAALIVSTISWFGYLIWLGVQLAAKGG